MVLYTHTHTPSLLGNEKNKNLKAQHYEKSKQENHKNSEHNKKGSKITLKTLFSKALLVLLIVALVVTGVLIINTKNNDKLGINKFFISIGANKNLANVGENTNDTNTTNANSAVNGEPSEQQKNTPVNNSITNALTDTENVKIYTDKNGDKVPIPKGYVGSKVTGENIVSTGYVIYEGTDEVTGNLTDGNVLEAQKTRNQWVWVPVLDPSQMYGTDINGKIWGKLYTGKTMQEKLNWEIDSKNYINIRNNDKNNYREPDVISSGDVDSDLRVAFYGETEKHSWLNALEATYKSQINSIKKYGGFYIGRYELGDITQDIPVVTKYNSKIVIGASWSTMYDKARRLAKNDSIATSIISGAAFDRTLQWILASGNKTGEQINDDSSSWGNYVNSAFEYSDDSGNIATKNSGEEKIIPTGSYEGAKANNIYDLAGNAYDWTLETGQIYGRVLRGGSYRYYSNNYNTANGRFPNDPKFDFIDYGYRVMLYLK